MSEVYKGESEPNIEGEIQKVLDRMKEISVSLNEFLIKEVAPITMGENTSSLVILNTLINDRREEADELTHLTDRLKELLKKSGK